MDYTTLIASKTTSGSIRRWMNYDALDVDAVIEDAMGWINARLRVPAMRKDWTGTIALNAETLSFPSDFVEEVWFGHTYPGRGRIHGMIPADAEALRTRNETTGALDERQPSRYWLGSDPPVARFDARADRAYNVRLVYLGKLALDSGTPTNWLTSRYPRIVRAACLGIANEWMKREADRDYWLKIAEGELQLVNIRHEMELKALEHAVGDGGFNG